jgi:phospholipase C
MFKKIVYSLMLAGALGAASAESAINNVTPPQNYPTVASPQTKLFKAAPSLKTQTPIKHLVIIFQENVSFDRYFATYPRALNLANETPFHAKAGTPSVNGLTPQLIESNPNSIKPYRMAGNFQPCSQDHDYPMEIKANNGGLLNKFVEYGSYQDANYQQKCLGEVMGYYDGNTVSAMWNYAQNFALNDNSFGTTFGPSTPGALNLVAGTTGPVVSPTGEREVIENGHMIEDPNPFYDDCSYGTSKSGDTGTAVAYFTAGKNIGDVLSAKGIAWGWFQGGFKADSYQGLSAQCNKITANHFGVKKSDYNPHHEPFQYYASTANPHHLAPSATKLIGSNDQANHQYDMSDFWLAAKAGKLPAVSYLKAPNYQDGHGGYSNPLDEQEWLVNNLNQLQQLPEWKDTAVIIMYDDTDGDYDHVAPPKSQFDDIVGRRGFGPRLPFLLISPYAKNNYVDHTLTDQSSVLKFIEYNWGIPALGADRADQYAGSILNMFDFNKKTASPKLFLDPKTGVVVPNHIK